MLGDFVTTCRTAFVCELTTSDAILEAEPLLVAAVASHEGVDRVRNETARRNVFPRAGRDLIHNLEDGVAVRAIRAAASDVLVNWKKIPLFLLGLWWSILFTSKDQFWG